MGCQDATHQTAVYRQRNPRASPLYQCVKNHYAELESAGQIKRHVEHQVLDRFIRCGDLHEGFARIYCDKCGHDYLLPFSCKTRYFCPSCHQKRMLLYGEWIEEEVLQPVPHRQYVFTLPKLLRPHFQRRERLGTFCRIVSKVLFRAYKQVAPWGHTGFILFVQTFGDLVTYHPHIHVLMADGVFSGTGAFRVLPAAPAALLQKLLQVAVLDYLVEEQAITQDFADKLLSWSHSGFSVDNKVRIAANDAAGRQQLARYMIRNPFSLEKMEYKPEQQVVVYRSKMHVTLKRNYQIMPGAAWLKLLLQHIPDRSEHRVRYYGWYSNRSRGERLAAAKRTRSITEKVDADSEVSLAARRSWARLIKKVYEADPLLCTHCGGEMRFIAVIDMEVAIERILRHIKAWEPEPLVRGPPKGSDWPAQSQIPFTLHPVPDIA